MSTQTEIYGGFCSSSELEFYNYVFNTMFKEDTNNENKYLINTKIQEKDIEADMKSTFQKTTSNNN